MRAGCIIISSKSYLSENLIKFWTRQPEVKKGEETKMLGKVKKGEETKMLGRQTNNELKIHTAQKKKRGGGKKVIEFRYVFKRVSILHARR